MAVTGAETGPAATPLKARTRTSYRVNFFRADRLNSVADHPFTVRVLNSHLIIYSIRQNSDDMIIP